MGDDRDFNQGQPAWASAGSFFVQLVSETSWKTHEQFLLFATSVFPRTKPLFPERSFVPIIDRKKMARLAARFLGRNIFSQQFYFIGQSLLVYL